MNLIHIDDVKGSELALYVSTSEAGLLHRFEPQKEYLSRRAPR